MGTEPEPPQTPDPRAQTPPKPDFGSWFAGACVAVVGLLFFGIQSRRQRPSKPEDFEFGGQRAGLVNVPTGGNSSMPGVSIGETALTPAESMPLKRPETFGQPTGPQELQGSPGEVFSRTLAARRDYYSRKTEQRSQESAVLRRFFDDWRSSPDLARLSSDYVRDQDAIKFARGAARSDQFSRIMKRYTLEADMRNFGMELLMGSPHDVMQAWTNYTAKDPEGSELQSKLFEAMGVPAPMAQVLGNGRTDATQMETQVRAMLPALLKGVDPRLLQQVQQNQSQPANP